MPDNRENLRARINAVPDSPGVYRWLNSKGEVLYVGKAKSLRSRMKNYVQKDPDKSLGPWKLSLIKHITDFDVTVTSSELEALILETNLIKEIKPKYNVLMKDDKNYVYVRISTEDYPQVSVVRQMEEDKAAYFGPFLSAYNIKRTLDTLHEIFRFRACDASVEKLNRGKQPEHACLQYQIGQCNGLCVNEVTKQQYNDAIKEVTRFLRGNRQAALHTLREMMDNAAAEKKFERAAKLRDILLYIQSLEEKQVVSDTSRENTDALGIAMRNGKAQVVLLRERGGKLIEERSFALAGEAETIADVIEQLIPQYYSVATDIPDLLLIPEETEGQPVLEQWLTQTREKKVEIRAPERGKKSKLLSLAISNAEQKISQQFAKWEAAAQNIETALQQLKDVLKLPTLPKRIEGYDISHLGGTETVGSMVVIKNGKPANKEYRSFTLRTIQEGEIDDYKAMKEVLRRRLKYLAEEHKDITLKKLKKKEREDWSKDQKNRLSVPKNWREEVLQILHNETVIATVDLRKSTKNKTLYGTLCITDDSKVHLVLDILEKKLGTQEWYLQSPDCTNNNALAIHGLLKAVKPIPQDFKPPTILTLHRRKTTEDSSLLRTPDLLLIDGGKGQLSAVVEVLKELQLTIPVAGLAKREEEVYLPNETLPEDLPNNSQASFLLQRLRDEAHRFSNAHREKRIAKGLIASILDVVPGIGVKTKGLLLKEFGTIENMKSASDKQLLTIVSPSQLSALRKALN